MSVIKRDSKTSMIFLYMLAYGLLLALYGLYLAPFWTYMGFTADPNILKISVASLVIMGFVLSIPAEFDTRSFFLNLLLTVYLLPSMVIYAYADKPTSSALTIWIALFIVYAVSAFRIPRFSLFNIRASILMWFLVATTLILLISYYILNGLTNFNLDFARVYEYRRSISSELPSIFGYISSSFSKIIIPLGLILSIVNRRYFISLIFISFSIALFGFTSDKASVFSTALVLMSYIFIFYYRSYKYMLFIFIFIFIIGLINVIFIYYYSNDSLFGWFNSLLIRRALFIPSLIDYYYIDYFSSNDRYLWSDSRISFGLISRTYDLSSPNLIGEIFFESKNTSANTGFIGSGFAQAGLLGVMIYSAGVGAVIAILRSYGRYLGTPFVTAVMVNMVFVMITATDFLTLFLTHGLLLAFVLLSLIRPPAPEKPMPPRLSISPASTPES